jgi:hypothetical protein
MTIKRQTILAEAQGFFRTASFGLPAAWSFAFISYRNSE